MALKYYKPVNASRRGLVLVDRKSLWKKKPFSALLVPLEHSYGRNNHGHITTRHISAGSKKRYRLIDFKRTSRLGDVAEVMRIEYDPNRTAFIALIKYSDGEHAYILAPDGLQVGARVSSGPDAKIAVGNALPLSHIPVGSMIANIELKPGAGGKMVRSAGAYAQLLGRDSGYAMIRLPSGEIRKVLEVCYATMGSISNADNKNIKLAKAGRSRWRGVRPTVRGVAMNPIDHPHGGGEGKTSGGRHPVTPWGKSTKGARTRKNRFTNKMIIKRRYKNG